MDKIKFVEINEVLCIHKGILEEHGGLAGVRDEGLLDSAINMPRATFNKQYLHTDIYEMAAAYAYHIIKNHPFLDGNKRVGIAIGVLFL